MTNAGWYPDPAGAPDTYRYWDGQAWSQMTTTQPSGGARPADTPATPPPAAPTQYGAVPTPPPAPGPAGPPAPPAPPPGYGGGYSQQWSPAPAPGGGGGNKTVVIVIAAVVALVLLGVGGFFGIRALTGDDDNGDRKADDDSSQSEKSEGSEPTDGSSSTVKPTGIQCTGGSPEPATDPDPAAPELTGGGLSIPRNPAYELATGDQVSFGFANAFVLQYTNVEEKWISLTGVGALPRDNGFDDLATAAEVVMQCLTGSENVYSGFTGRTDKVNEETTVDGKPAYRITAEVRVDTPEVQAEGDLTDVIVVDTGDPATYGIYIGMAALGHDDLISTNEGVIDQIKVG
ncbi:DUF2510 domain-containing protein [Nocardioides sp. SLBN-35]|uniref:DUF2510 domain-containing protein n=1 Tax=Nocardioides sp. SLBN-35 TaxID=2768445 RepID=UPI00116B9FCC|nr:DUF2510 domain-containing protein [Nocardioides sp. SLBN-35]TQK68282.1 uncharacterized protein DUF2510 [Nocardioides sp. SLBN-35]